MPEHGKDIWILAAGSIFMRREEKIKEEEEAKSTASEPRAQSYDAGSSSVVRAAEEMGRR